MVRSHHRKWLDIESNNGENGSFSLLKMSSHLKAISQKLRKKLLVTEGWICDSFRLSNYVSQDITTRSNILEVPYMETVHLKFLTTIILEMKAPILMQHLNKGLFSQLLSIFQGKMSTFSEEKISLLKDL